MLVAWVNSLPKQWEAKPLRAVSNYIVSNVDKATSDNEVLVRLCNYTDVYYNEYITLDLDFMNATASEHEIEKFGLSIGDVILTKDSESWDDIGVPTLVRETADDLVCGYHLALLQPRADVMDGAFLFRCIQAKPIRLQLELSARGVTRFGLPKSEIGTMVLPVPPLSQQRAIVGYLEHETARLDKLVATKERMLELLAERRQALVVAAVARGIDSAVRLKPSPDAILADSRWNEAGTIREGDRKSAVGADGLNMRPVPVYPTTRLKHVVSLRQSRVSGNGSSSPYVGLENIEPWTGRLLNGVPTVAGDSAQCNVFSPGDVLFGKLRPYLAKVWVAEFAGRSTTECLVMKPVELESRFLGYVCLGQNFIDAVNASTFGSKMPRAEWSFIGNIPVPVPKRQEQRAIADYLDRETTRLDKLKVKINRTITLLKERRASLIAAAVTGQIEVGCAA